MATADLIRVADVELQLDDSMLRLRRRLLETSIKRHAPSELAQLLVPLLIARAAQWDETIQQLKVLKQLLNDSLPLIKRDVEALQQTHQCPVYLVGDVLGGLASYDLLARSQDEHDRRVSSVSTPTLPPSKPASHRQLSDSSNRRSFDSQTFDESNELDVSGVFLFNCPLAYYLLSKCDKLPKVPCQLYNIFYPMDAAAARIEPLFQPDSKSDPVILNRFDLWQR